MIAKDKTSNKLNKNSKPAVIDAAV